MKSSAKLKSVEAQESASLSLDTLRAWREMLLIRRFEEKAGQLYGMGHIIVCLM